MSVEALLKLVPFSTKRRKEALGQSTYTSRLSFDDLINAESALGRTIFGPVPEGHQREFFKHKDNVWFWHENWTDPTGQLQEMTIRYEVRPAGVYKSSNGSSYKKLEGDELTNFRRAAGAYLELVKTKLYC